jgi:2-polyprenyl-3-methyl-5-hydroxy-6-metoxy-1,4-benzoquinol methylase
LTGVPIKTVDLPCTGCGATNDELLFVGREHEYDDTTDEPFQVVRCRDCGLVRLNPRPDVSELGRIYPPNYYAYHLIDDFPAQTSGVRTLVQRIKQRMYQRRLEGIVSRGALDSAARIRLLDVGCADGRLLDWYKASRSGDRIETWGIDLSKDAVEIAEKHGHRAVLGRFEEDTELPLKSFDLILAGHVIEHVDDPHKFTAHAFELLTPGGLFVVATPNFDSLDVRLFGKNWGGNHFPRHWTLYDAKSIGQLAGSVGFTVERVDYEVNPVFWNWSIHSLLRDRFPQATWPDRAFPTVDIFHPSLQSFVLLSIFTGIDLVQRVLTGKTASMSVELRKPPS